jgi:purine-cytosine permease-like protein
LDLVVAMPISWWPLISDYNRFARSPRQAAAGTSLGYIAANTSFYLIGAALVFLGITSFGLNPQDPYAFLASLGLLGLSAVPLIAILVDETDNAFADVYSAAVSVQNLSVRRRQATTIVASALIAIVAAGYLVASGQGIGGPYETFLLLIGGLFVPLLGVVIAETFVVRREGYSPSDFFQTAPRWRWPAFASWLPGTALYFAIVWFGLPIGATLPSFALAASLHIVFSKVEQGFARSSPLVSSGDP